MDVHFLPAKWSGQSTSGPCFLWELLLRGQILGPRRSSCDHHLAQSGVSFCRLVCHLFSRRLPREAACPQAGEYPEANHIGQTQPKLEPGKKRQPSSLAAGASIHHGCAGCSRVRRPAQSVALFLSLTIVLLGSPRRSFTRRLKLELSS